MEHTAKTPVWAGKAGLTILLLGLAVESMLEIIVAFAQPQNWNALLSPLSLLTIVGAVCLLLAGMVTMIVALWASGAASRISARLKSWHWVVQIALLFFVIWFTLFSSWQAVFIGFWTHYLFFLAIACLVMITSGQQEIKIGWREALLALVWLLYTGMVQEVRQMTATPLAYRGVTIAGALLVGGTAWLLYHNHLLRAVGQQVQHLRRRSALLRWAFIIFLASTPVVLLYIEGRTKYALNPYSRYSILLLVLPLLAALLSRKEEENPATLEGWLTATGVLIFGTALSNHLTRLTNYPFSLTWSEGNRLYDYSLIFADHLYNYPAKISIPYFAPARYALWGSLFMIPGLPIWAHRLWDILLQTLPALAVGWMIARPLRRSHVYVPLLLWVTLYILQGPIHPPLLVSLLMFLPFITVPNPWTRATSLALASLAAGLSRWTWAVGPAALGVLVELFLYYPRRKGNLLERVLPAAGMALAGALPGMLVSWGEAMKRTGTLTASQPLLWYRLWPNATYAPGILLGILLASGPLVILLIWLAVSRRWKMDIIQALAAAGASTGFWGAGIVISMKIGGGGDLHNLDLFLLTTALLAGLAVYRLYEEKRLTPTAWPRWAQVMLVLCLLAPAWNGLHIDEPPSIPEKTERIQTALKNLRQAVASYQTQGEILFMDQRQLLTFGYVKDVPFVPEYEKKYVMDQAMAANRLYFQPFYQDLATHRFALIISEPLRTPLKRDDYEFGEENNAWVTWVAEPILCYYQPIQTYEEVRLQLLVPKTDTQDCLAVLPTNQE